MVNTRTTTDPITPDLTNTLTAIQTAIDQINGTINGLLLFQQKLGWLYRVNQFFLLDSIPDNQKVRLVSMHMFDKALNWHKQFVKKYGENVKWTVYEREEATLQVVRTKHTALLSTPRTPYVQSASYANRNPRKQLTQKEIADKRAKNLCFYCDEKFVPGHKSLVRRTIGAKLFGNSVSETPVISLHAMTGETTYKTMRVKSYVGKHIVHSLIDSGSTHRSMDKVCKMQRLNMTLHRVEVTSDVPRFYLGEAFYSEGAFATFAVEVANTSQCEAVKRLPWFDRILQKVHQNLGGRDFDEILFKHFAAQFLEQYKIDVYSNARASLRLCEKLKKVLSANTEASLSIECLMEDTDVRGILTRNEFEKLSSELLQRVTTLCRKALKDSGLSVDKIYTIELVGSGSRIPAITKSLTSLFQKEPTRTPNASECVARGCALRCAMLSPTLQVRDYEGKDLFPYSIAIPLDKLKNQGRQEIMLFPKGSLFPNTYLITRNGTTPFSFQVSYTNMKDLPAGVSPLVGHFKSTSDSEKLNVEIVVMLNHHGIFEIKSASVGVWLSTSQPPPYTVEDGIGTHNPWKTVMGVTLPYLFYVWLQQKMSFWKLKEENRNTLESFVYDTRVKLKSAYKRFLTDLENEGITKSLQETEEWLYEDSDDDSDEQGYARKLEDLEKLLKPVEYRYTDEQKVQAVKPLLAMIEEYRLVADSLPYEYKIEIESIPLLLIITTFCIAVVKLSIMGYDTRRPKAIL
ncbi:heat shock 70 kDa protein 16 [Tanacetum coccineum]